MESGGGSDGGPVARASGGLGKWFVKAIMGFVSFVLNPNSWLKLNSGVQSVGTEGWATIIKYVIFVWLGLMLAYILLFDILNVL